LKRLDLREFKYKAGNWEKGFFNGCARNNFYARLLVCENISFISGSESLNKISKPLWDVITKSRDNGGKSLL
jgi:hypothetical protein